jgi:EAL domain-containing protein (putative c-di-GMP-specific phosphodiesterase class I)
VQGVEALTRWFDPEKGDIEPAYFIPLTERTLLINPFTKWLLERTYRDMNRWQEQGIHMRLAVNFSMRNFHDSSVLAHVSSLAETYKIDPKDIEIEITESAFSTDMKSVISAVELLRSKGVKISIDDFGTGLASQQYLFELPVDGLKIDKIFVDDIVDNQAAQAIVQSAISLGHKLDLEIVAEGVETKEQYKVLANMGCDVIQGFTVAEPMPYDKLISWLKNHEKKRAG